MPDIHNFWIISLEDFRTQVILVSVADSHCQIVVIGPYVGWSLEVDGSLDKAIDQSLSEAAASAQIPPQKEATGAAFIIPPFWVSPDGKIATDKLKLIESACKNLKLQPLGFIANDDAVVEAANLKEGLPTSFILVDISPTQVFLSLTYLGKIKKRIRKSYAGEFDPSLIENGLTEMDLDSALPPQLSLIGAALNSQVVDQIKNYPWIGKSNVETFLHLPEIKVVPDRELIDIYVQVISKQMNIVVPSEPLPVIEEPITEIKPALDETAITDFGFQILSDESDEPASSADIPLNLAEVAVPVPDAVSETPPVVRPKFVLPQFHLRLPSLPRVRFNFLFPLVPIIVSIPLFLFIYLSKATVNLSVTPYSFDEKAPVLFSTSADNLSGSPLTVPVTQRSITTSVTGSIPTTGQKTIGDKAKGEIIIYNKSEQAVKLSKGAVFTDNTGKKFLLNDDVAISGSSSDLSQGVITMGQVKALVTAADIGPEYNLAQDAKFSIQNDNLLAKANTPFTGGSKRDVNTVATSDKATLQNQLNSQISAAVQDKISSETPGINGLISQTIQTHQNTIDFNREVGEEATEVTGTLDATTTVMVLDSTVQEKLINEVMKKNHQFSQIAFNPNNFTLTYEFTTVTATQAQGTVTVKGTSSPLIDTNALAAQLTGRSLAAAKNILKSTNSRIYDYHISWSSFSPLRLLNILPFRTENISVVINTSS